MNAAAQFAPWPLWQVIAAGVLLGVAYTLSPMTVLMLPCLVLLAQWAGRPLGQLERQWFYVLMIVAVTLRLAAIGGLFLSASADQPFATFFGDEELFKFRSLWLRNMGLGVPISPADIIYAVEETGRTSYLFVLAYLSALVGAAPYGVHLFNTLLYLAGLCADLPAGAAELWPARRFLRARRAAVPAEPVPLVDLRAEGAALHLPGGPRARRARCISCAAAQRKLGIWRLAAIAAIVGLGVLLEGLRKGGLLVAGIGTHRRHRHRDRR